jgi:hypothetical protein
MTGSSRISRSTRSGASRARYTATAARWVRATGVPAYRRGMTEDQAWVPTACTLPTVDRPLRPAEFDELFATALRGQHRLSATTLRWEFDPAAQAAARDLTGRESSCCSFFAFAFTPAAARTVAGTLRAALTADCDDLVTCAAHPGCLIPFAPPTA